MRRSRILVVGDVLFDRYTYVVSERTSQEAPIPVWDEVREEYRLGGAANVANNLKALCGDSHDVYLAGLVGASRPPFFSEMADAAGINVDFCFTGGGSSLTKHRYVEDGPERRYVGRFDHPKRLEKEFVEHFDMMFGFAVPSVDSSFWDAVIISDYDKGTVTERVASALVGNADIPVVVDSKRRDLQIFRGATVLKVNEGEYNIQLANRDYRSPGELFKYVVVTKGPAGSDIHFFQSMDDGTYRTDVQHVPVTMSVTATDVTGCGDTHTAALTFCLVGGHEIHHAVRFANNCAASVVRKFGTSTADPS